MSCSAEPGLRISHPVLRVVLYRTSEREAEDPAGPTHRRGEEDDPQPLCEHQQMHLFAVPLALLRVVPQIPDVHLQAVGLGPAPTAH